MFTNHHMLDKNNPVFCLFCNGIGRFFKTVNGVKEWPICFACHGIGATELGPSFIQVHGLTTGKIAATVIEVSMTEFDNFSKVAVSLGIFPSLTQAKKNGWDKPVTLGTHKFGKRTFNVT